MNPERIAATGPLIAGVARMALAVPADDLREYIAAIDYCDTVSPVVDPTWFKGNDRVLRSNRKIAAALLAFHEALGQIDGEWRGA